MTFFTILYNSAHTKHTLKPADKGEAKSNQYWSTPLAKVHTHARYMGAVFSVEKLLQRLPIYTTPSSGCVLSEAE